MNKDLSIEFSKFEEKEFDLSNLDLPGYKLIIEEDSSYLLNTKEIGEYDDALNSLQYKEFDTTIIKSLTEKVDHPEGNDMIILSSLEEGTQLACSVYAIKNILLLLKKYTPK